eukprot:gene20200-1048_t
MRKTALTNWKPLTKRVLVCSHLPHQGLTNMLFNIAFCIDWARQCVGDPNITNNTKIDNVIIPYEFKRSERFESIYDFPQFRSLIRKHYDIGISLWPMEGEGFPWTTPTSIHNDSQCVAHHA